MWLPPRSRPGEGEMRRKEAKTAEGQETWSLEERDSEVGGQRTREIWKHWQRCEKKEKRLRAGDKDAGMGDRDTETEVERAPQTFRFPAEGWAHAGKVPSAAHKSGARTATAHVGPGTKAWDLLC